ncbi:Surp module [Popillia japonica]|uniref:Surp module n=1 Tax=Popillia japonica TaxID=7064 RepID=A0AAW1LAP7_POPJA
MSKRDFERKHREEQEATAHAFQEFIQTFQDNSTPPSKLFVKSGILYAKDKENDSEKGKIYNPKPLVKAGSADTIKKAIECARLLKESKIERQKGNEKPKSNLELLKEELRMRHLERDVRTKARSDVIGNINLSCYESDDQTTTNLFVANINPSITEQDLMQIFGVYGPLASVKIMWPRGDEKGRTNNVGFVAFMSRKDGERALENLKNRDDIRIGWGKPVEIPTHPVYIPPELLKLLLPPPHSGLPFNAQPRAQSSIKNEDNLSKALYDAVVNVTVPLEKKVLCVIHRVIEFVVREGPLFEAMIMNKEINNPIYQFLFDNKSPHHTYYRWKLFSILNGEGVYNWSNKEFRMFKGGSVWVPPILPDYTRGMPDEFIKSEKTDRKMLSQAQRTRLIHFIQNLNVNRLKIGEAMVFCMNHEEAAKDVVALLTESFENDSTNPGKKMARLFLLSDILYNSGVKKVNTTRKFVYEFENNLLHIFEMLEKCCNNLKNTHERDAFKFRVLKVIRSWDLWKIYQSDFLKQVEQKFLKQAEIIENGDDSATDEPLDGNNLIKRSLQNVETNENNSNVTILENIKSRRNVQPNLADFIPSKWESVKPEDIEAQAMSTKKIYDLELERQRSVDRHEKKLSEEQRDLLRKIEVLVVQYQDELESGKRKRKRGRSMEEEILQYRKNLINKYKHKQQIEHTSPISSDSFSSDDERREPNRRKKYRKKDKDKEKHTRHYKN